MSIVIIGGHDRMVCQYKKVCQKYQCKAKVFTQMSGNLSKDRNSGSGRFIHKHCFAQNGAVCSGRSRPLQCRDHPLPYKQQKRTGRYPGNCLCSSVKTISFKRAR